MRTERSLRAPLRRRKLLSGLLVGGLIAGSAAIALPAQADQITDKRAEAAQVADQLDQMQSKLMDLGARAEAAGYELSKAEAKVQEAQQRLDQTNAELDKRKGELRTFAVKAYQSGNDDPELNALLTADGDKAPAKKSYIEVTTGNRQDLVDSLGAMRRQAEDESLRVQQAQAEAKRVNDELESAKSETQKTVDAQSALNSKVQGELSDLVAQEQARRAAEAEKARQAAAQQAAAQQAATRQAQTANQPSAPAPTTRSTGGGGGGGAPAPAPSGPPAPMRSGLQGAIDAAMSKIGSPYVWGAAGPNAFDCSGLVAWAFEQVGISLPHYSGAQYSATRRVSRDQLQPGDLVFWGAGGSEHVAIYMGGNQLVHAYSSGRGVGTTPLDGWWKPPTGYGRIS